MFFSLLSLFPKMACNALPSSSSTHPATGTPPSNLVVAQKGTASLHPLPVPLTVWHANFGQKFGEFKTAHAQFKDELDTHSDEANHDVSPDVAMTHDRAVESGRGLLSVLVSIHSVIPILRPF